MATINVPAGGDLNGALYNAQPGDIVVAGAGDHVTALWINQRDGTAAAPITLRGAPGAILKPPASAWNGISVNAHYVVIEGLEIVGARGDGIEANGVHHVTIRNCKVRNCGESGIQTNQADHVVIEGNVCEGNGSTGWFSGISLYQNREAGGAHVGIYRNIVRNNICRNNLTLTGAHTDGNGIIIDDFQSTQTAGFPNYVHPTLVENNLCHDNGGKGIQVTWSDNVTVLRNTCVRNNRDQLNTGTWRGDLSISQSKGARVERNIVVCVRGTGILANNRALDNTSTTSGFNTTNWVSGIGWDASGTPSVRLDGGNIAPGSAITWANPNLDAAYLPQNSAAANHGWRPVSAPTTPVNPTPQEPTIMELSALIASLQAYAAALEARLAAVEARPAPADLTARVAAAEAEITALKSFDQKVKDL